MRRRCRFDHLFSLIFYQNYRCLTANPSILIIFIIRLTRTTYNFQYYCSTNGHKSKQNSNSIIKTHLEGLCLTFQIFIFIIYLLVFLCEYLIPNLHITISVSYPILIYENTFSLVKKIKGYE